MSARHVLARRPPVIETLCSATAISVDKTGTLTMNGMTVAGLVAGGSVRVLDGGPLPEPFHEIAEFAVLASIPTRSTRSEHRWVRGGTQGSASVMDLTQFDCHYVEDSDDRLEGTGHPEANKTRRRRARWSRPGVLTAAVG